MSNTVSIPDFHKMVNEPNDFLMLDVRNTDAFEAWQIEGLNTPNSMNIPYFEFIEDEEANIAKVPTDKKIVVVCAHGGSSEYVAELLRGVGADAISLEQGMEGWGNYYVTREAFSADNYAVYQVDRVSRGCLSHVLISEGEAVIIDPLRHTDKYEAFLQSKGAKLTLLLDTHAHADHVSGGPALADASGAPYYLHPYDGIHPFDILPPKIHYHMMDDGQEFTVGALKIRVIHTPGHTLGQVNFLVSAPDGKHFFFSGDTLFIESFGRPDLGGQGESWAPIVYETIFEVIKTNMPEDAYLFPGHYARFQEANSDGLFMKQAVDLWKENSALQMKSREEFVNYVLNHLPHMPEQYIEIKRVNAGLSEPDEEGISELELGKNICALSEAYEG